MARIDVDLPDTEPKTGGSDFVPEGKYLTRVTGMKTVTSKNDTPGIAVRFEIVSGEYDGSQIQNTYWLTDKAVGIFQGFLKACGVTYKGKGVNAQAAMNKTVRIKTIVEKGNDGKEYARVNWCEPNENQGPAAPTVSESEKLDLDPEIDNGW